MAAAERPTSKSSEQAEGSATNEDAASWRVTTSFVAVYLANLFNVVNFTIVIPTSSAYAASLAAEGAWVGIIVGLHPFSQGVVNLPTAYALQRVQLRHYLLFACAIYVLGDIVYALAGSTGSVVTLVVARLLMGSAGGPQLPSTYVARAFNKEQRSSAMLAMSSANALAYAVGPFFALLLELVCEAAQLDGELLNPRTSPGWLMAVLCGCLFVYILVFFEEPPKHADAPSSEKNPSSSKFSCLGLAAAYMVIFSVALVIASWEVHLALVAEAEWHWSRKLCALYLCAVMLLMAPVSLAGGRMAKRVSDKRALQTFAPCALLPALLFLVRGLDLERSLEVTLFTVASVLMILFATLERGFVQSLTTKLAPALWRQYAIGGFAICWLCGRGFGAVLGSVLHDTGPYTWCLLTLLSIKLVVVTAAYTAGKFD